MQKPADARGWPDSVCRHMGAGTHARARARAHTHTPLITSGMERTAADWSAQPSLTSRRQGDFARQFLFSLFPAVSFNGKTAELLKVSHLRGKSLPSSTGEGVEGGGGRTIPT